MGGRNKAVAYALSGALVASQIVGAAATPLPADAATMKSMVANLETPAYWRGGRGWGGWGWGLGAGLFVGAVVGGAIASGAYGYYGAPYYYEYGHPYQPYGYDYPYSYSYSPAYYGCTTYCGYHPRYYNYW